MIKAIISILSSLHFQIGSFICSMIITNEFAAYPYKYTGLERKIQFFNANSSVMTESVNLAMPVTIS
ncbi:hypothetical protein A7D23_10030 [Dehalobacter sp. TeCB1]|uniref:Uncharacterized protein n=1 Tax=Dehalobacter restrictus (strain DSM 9455 / PER-K23) TaxID=871738 RepID=A0ABM5P9G6_DEHRP|nr:hypothetical protein DEHRE_08030 [Dehalobacter restrictus DSM 9455]OCZ52490.1 hypothetical protein A7D23_10030 [Dehalobacter sp. TeCB1]